MSKVGQRILDGLNDAIAGNFAAVTIEGQHWVRRPEWQAIETAPKDGTFILLFGNQKKHEMVSFGGRLVFSGYWDAIDSSWCSHGSTCSGPFYTPTHWMPLPAAPSPS